MCYIYFFFLFFLYLFPTGAMVSATDVGADAKKSKQLLNQVLKALSNMQSDNVNNDKLFLLSMYENVQNLEQGQSLSVKDAFNLKRLLKSATS